MTTIEFLNSPVARALGWTLLHALWQGFALVLPTAISLHLLRRRSSLLRYRIGTLALLVQTLVSAATFVEYYQPVTATSRIATTVAALPLRWSISAQPLPWPQQVLLFLETHLSDFVCLYLIGVSLFGLRLAGGWLQLHQLRRSAVVSPLLAEQAMIDRLRSALDLRTVVLVRESARVAGPMIIGVLKPMLLLPAGLATGLSTRELEAVLAHELAHVKRYDYAVNLLQSVVETLYFFHPALWWLSARVREEREHCCDDMAVQVCGDKGRALARALARIEERRLERATTPALAMAFAGKRQLLLHRVQRVLGLSTRSLVSNRSLAGLTLATLLLVSASVYAIQRQDKLQQPKPKTPVPAVHRSASATELHFDSNRQLTYILWKGQKLPATRVADLQQKWAQVMSGQVNLDDVAQPDRDILLNVIESQYGKISSSEQAKYEAITDAALTNIPLSPDGTLEGLAKVNYDSIIQGAFASLQTAKANIDSVIKPDGMTFLRNYDSLAERQAMNREKTALLKLQAQKLQFAVDAAERSIEQIERQKLIVERRRFSQTVRQQQLVMGSDPVESDSAQSVIDKQIAASESIIRKTESELEAVERRLMSAQDELEKAQKPLRDLESQIRKLNYTAYNTSGWGTTGDGMTISGTNTRKRSTLKHRVVDGTVIPVAPAPPAIEVRPAKSAKSIQGKAVIAAPAAPPRN